MKITEEPKQNNSEKKAIKNWQKKFKKTPRPTLKEEYTI